MLSFKLKFVFVLATKAQRHKGIEGKPLCSIVPLSFRG